MLPLSPGRAESHGFEYKSNGTLSLFAALNTATGEVLGRPPRDTPARSSCLPRRRGGQPAQASDPCDLRQRQRPQDRAVRLPAARDVRSLHAHLLSGSTRSRTGSPHPARRIHAASSPLKDLDKKLIATSASTTNQNPSSGTHPHHTSFTPRGGWPPQVPTNRRATTRLRRRADTSSRPAPSPSSARVCVHRWRRPSTAAS